MTELCIRQLLFINFMLFDGLNLLLIWDLRGAKYFQNASHNKPKTERPLRFLSTIFHRSKHIHRTTENETTTVSQT